MLAFAWIATTALVAWFVAVLLRDGLVARDDLGAICASACAPAWCALRQLVVQAFLNHAFSTTSLVFAAVAAWRRSAWAAHVAIAAGVAGLVLWDYRWSVVGVLGGALVLARLQGQWQHDTQADRGD
jgi:hypothetical protein